MFQKNKRVILMKKYFWLLCITLFLVGCSPKNQPIEEGHESDPPREEPAPKVEKSEEEETASSELTVLSENLNAPWAIEKTDDVFYVSERPGSVVKIENGETTRQQVELSDEIATAAEAGFLGFVLAPDFSESNVAYAYYTYRNESGQFNRIVQLTLEEDIWIEGTILLDDIPSGDFHHGGRLLIGPNGLLYAGTGDAADTSLAQEGDSLGGKILQMNLDGSIPEDNPLNDSYVLTSGHRNVQGMAWLEDGTMYASEHGNQANDEVNLIETGGNYGWPLIEGIQEREGFISPIVTSGTGATWAPSGMAAADHTLFVAGLRGNAVYSFDLETGEEQAILTDYGRIRDIYIEDDFLYFITNNTDGRGEPEDADDRLYRIGLSDLE